VSIYADRVNQPVTTPGTGPLTLGSTPTAGYQTFLSAFGTGTTTVAYCIADQSGTNWEVGSGSYNGTTNVLTRPATPLSSSNAGAIVNFNTGTQDVFCDAPAAYLDTFTSAHQGTVPASGGGTTNFLRADGSFAAPPVTAPAGSDTQVQYNAAGVFGANANFAYTVGTNTLTVGNLTGIASTSGTTSPAMTLQAGAPTATQSGGALTVKAANATGSAKTGGALFLRAGTSSLGPGGGTQIYAGDGTVGGALSINTGYGSTGSSGALNISTGGGPTIGALNISGGQNSGIGAGGSLVFRGGATLASGAGGPLTFAGGDSQSGNGGTLTFVGGNSTVYGANPASITLAGALPTGAGSDINIQAGDAGLGSNANPGNITFTTGLIDGFGGSTSGGYFAVINQNNPSYPLKIAVDASGLVDQIGFFGVTPISKPTVTGSRATGAALQNLLTKLAALGLITDSTTV
jgi:hypothetical protein